MFRYYLRKAIRAGMLWIFPILYGKNWWYKLRSNEAMYSEYRKLCKAVDIVYDKFIKISVYRDHIIAITPMGTLVKNFVDWYDLETFKHDMQQILLDNVYTAKTKINSNDYVLDIGAHVGIFTLYASNKARGVIALEPHPINFRYLKINLKLNGLDNVTPLNIAVSNYDGFGELYVAPKSSDHSLVPRRRPKGKFVDSIRVLVRRVDSLVRELALPDDVPLFVKIDVEGAELEVVESVLTLKNPLKLSIAAYHYPDEARYLINVLNRNGLKSDILYYGSEVYVYAKRP